jgi:hypothetical protein
MHVQIGYDVELQSQRSCHQDNDKKEPAVKYYPVEIEYDTVPSD